MRRKKEKKKAEIEDIALTRRDMLKVSSAAIVTAPLILTARKSTAQSTDDTESHVSEPVLCGTVAPISPPTRPFADSLPIPGTLSSGFLFPRPTKSANIAYGEAARANHQRWEEFLPRREYQLTARAATHRFHTDLSPSYIWGFNGRYPGPMLRNSYGSPVIVRFRNSLPEPTTSFGKNEMTIHLHNGHTGSESDGFAGDFFGTGLWKDNHYLNAYAGIDTFSGGDPREAMNTFWYHEHRAAFTARNNYLGLNGMYLLYNRKDPGHEDNAPDSLRLPGIYGVTDIPLILTDKKFCAAQGGRNELFQVVGQGSPAGDKWIVNGKIQPKLRVGRRKYRFRILNTGPTKTWNISLIKPDGQPGTMTVISTDANFLESPVDVTALPINVAERFDFVVDFKAFPVGSKVYVREAQAQNVGMPAPDPLPPNLAIENVLMRFDVISDFNIPPDTPPIPTTLTEYPPLPAPHTNFTWGFTLVAGDFLVNGLTFDANRIDHAILQGTTEEWDLRNDVIAGNWTHPVHIHFEEFRVLQRQRRLNPGIDPPVYEEIPLTPLESGRKDVIVLPPQHRVRLRMQFRDLSGRYLIHCHNMNHEDDFMMVRWDILDSLSELNRRKHDIALHRRAAGLSFADKEVL